MWETADTICKAAIVAGYVIVGALAFRFSQHLKIASLKRFVRRIRSRQYGARPLVVNDWPDGSRTEMVEGNTPDASFCFLVFDSPDGRRQFSLRVNDYHYGFWKDSQFGNSSLNRLWRKLRPP